ncbi:gamma-glutamylcysteine synthetase [Liquorilactobacillus sucicola DSM 21376 = JCM 15457]|uniref:Glutamate--cysteine ligase n=2 Tax=Liquorilactobacillus sucicola TaxID=519050 RepID=A0A0R2DWT5_9LACO|nr:gamma-glutamylcysteine synthetase [Liquorilactobacillus sucicola DSM 21376 = JCM 15457]
MHGMLDNLLDFIRKDGLSKQLEHSFLGIEVEEHRIDRKGRLSRNPHPQKLGSRDYHPYLQSDFAESQSEIITDPLSSVEDVMQQLNTLQTVLAYSLQNDDRIWPFSMPPALDESDRHFIAKHFDRPAYKEYRDYLIEKYGVARKIITGVHVNYSIPDSFFAHLYQHYQHDFESLTSFKNMLYFRITQNFVLHRWLLTYLFGASPIPEAGFFADASDPCWTHPVRSIRNSRFGYVNDSADHVNVTLYSSFDSFVSGIETAVEDHHLFGPAEFYGPVRLRGQERLNEYRSKGISYLEFRVFDNDPFSANGISRDTLVFLKIFLLYLLLAPVDEQNIEDKLKEAFDENDRVALERPDKPTFKQREGIVILEKMTKLVKDVGVADHDIFTVLQKFTDILAHPQLTPAARLLPFVNDGSLREKGVEIASAHKKAMIKSDALLPSLSNFAHQTQTLIFKSVELGIRYTVRKSQSNKEVVNLTSGEITRKLKLEDYKEITLDNSEKYLRELFPTLK